MAGEFVTPIRSPDEIELEQPLPELSQTPRASEFHPAPEIDNTNKNFKGQQKNEVVLAFCRKHWVVLLPHIIGLIGGSALIVLFLLYADTAFLKPFISQIAYRIATGIIIIGATYVFHVCFIRFLNYYLQVLIVTNFRIVVIDQTLYFSRNRDSVDLNQMQDVVAQRSGIIKTILNYGEIIITLSASHATKTLTFVPNPEYYFRKINKTKRAHTSEHARASASALLQ